MITAIIAGYVASLSLILAIGAQNAFVLRQGLRGSMVLPIVLVCGLSDAVLIGLGVGGFATLGPVLPKLAIFMRWAGIVFLAVYGALRFRAAWRGGEALLPAHAPPASRMAILTTCALITWANPHVYLDTVMLIGSLSAHYHPNEWIFGLGAACGSASFFFALGYGARLLAPLLASVRAWIILEIAIGATMWAIAATLMMKAP